MSERTQWVNLPIEHQDGLVDGRLVTSAAQVGPEVAVRLQFEKSGATAASYRIVPEPDNVQYADTEVDRWDGYRMWIAGRIVKPDGPHEVASEQVVMLPQAGANRYAIEALDDTGKVVRSRTSLVTRRLVHYQIVAMGGTFGAPKGKPGGGKAMAETQAAMQQVVDELKAGKNAIEMVHVGPDGVVAPMNVHEVASDTDPRMPSDSTYKSFLADVKRSFKPIAPRVSVAIALVPTLARKKRRALTLGFGPFADGHGFCGDVFFEVDEKHRRLQLWLATERSPAGPHLWEGFSDAEDDRKSWFEGFNITFADELVPAIARNGTHVAVAGRPVSEWGGYTSFVVALGDQWELVRRNWQKRFSVSLTVQTVEWYGGLSFPGSGVIAVAERCRWKRRDKASKARTLLHELGHRFGLAAAGDVEKRNAWQPDKHGDHYDEHTAGSPHRGPHCKAGVPDLSAPPRQWKPACVMFGQASADRFCLACAEDLRLVDLTDVTR